ncbi:MAG: undecaprenyl-diphosphate phosphatase [Rhodospirillales bacterium]|jgi:undecaprenyl-diphosphatase
MTVLQIVVLAIVQGITEFLPISSQAHLELVPVVSGWPDQGLLIDVAVHVGTLGAVILYFWRDLFAMVGGIFRLVQGRRDPGALLAWYLIVGTLPVISAGYVMNTYYPNAFRSVEVIGWATLGFGIILYISDKVGMTVCRIEHLRFLDVLFIGCSQALALIPGTSRSGITMTAARILGMERSDAARFSMLLSIPAIIGAGTLKGYELYQSGDATLTNQAGMAAGLAFISALVVIAMLMAWLKRATFTPFVIYRIVLGCVLLGVVYGTGG